LSLHLRTSQGQLNFTNDGELFHSYGPAACNAQKAVAVLTSGEGMC